MPWLHKGNIFSIQKTELKVLKMYLTLHIKEAKNTLSSAEIPFSGLAINLLSSATVNAAFFPTFDDL